MRSVLSPRLLLGSRCCALVFASMGMLTVGAVQAAPVAGGSLNPLSIPKYVTSLTIPPEMPAKQIDPVTGKKTYDIEVVQFRQQILPNLDINNVALGKTTVWGYGATGLPATRSYPARTLETTRNVEANITWRNNLTEVAGKFLPHLFAVDRSLHWANPEHLPCLTPGAVPTAAPNTGTDCRPDPVINGVLLQATYPGGNRRSARSSRRQ